MSEQSGFLRDSPDPGFGLGRLLVSDARRFSGGKSAMTAQVTTTGQTVILTPDTGKAITVFWVSALNDPDQAQSPRIRVGFQGASDYLYSSYAIAHWEMFTGNVNQALVVDLDQTGDVAVTVHYTQA